MTVDPDLTNVEPSGRRFLALAPLVRAIGLAGDARKLILGVAGLALLLAGWGVIDAAFGVDPREVGQIDPAATIRLFDGPTNPRWTDAAWLVSEPARTVVGPFFAVFSRGVGVRPWFLAVLMGIWALVVWGIIGGAIARIAVVRLTVGGGVGIGSAIRFALRRALALIGAPMTPFLAVALIALGCGGFGLLYRIPAGIGALIAGVFGFIPLIGGLVMALILIGLALGWPLMHATVATEGEDVADALSRSYSYVNQRLIRYLAHVGAAWLLGVVGLVVAVVFARVVLGLADWSVSLGAPARPTTTPFADTMREFWTAVVGWLVHAYLYSYFWSAASAIYLTLRQDVDGTDPHDVYLPEQAADTFAGGPSTTSPDQPVEA